MNRFKSFLVALALALAILPLKLAAQIKADTAARSSVSTTVIAPCLPVASPVFFREVKVKDPDTGSKYWLAYTSNQDIAEIRKSGVVILRTRKRRKRTKNGKGAELWPKIIPSVIEVLPYFVGKKQRTITPESN